MTSLSSAGRCRCGPDRMGELASYSSPSQTESKQIKCENMKKKNILLKEFFPEYHHLILSGNVLYVFQLKQDLFQLKAGVKT